MAWNVPIRDREQRVGVSDRKASFRKSYSKKFEDDVYYDFKG